MASTSLTRSGFLPSSYYKYDDFLVGNAAYDPAATFLIQRISPTSGSSVTFSSIPSTYKNLQIRFSAITSSATEISGTMTGSGDYVSHELFGYYAAGSDRVGTNANTGQTKFNYIYGGGAQTVTTYPTVGIIDIIDYTNTSKNKVIRSMVGSNNNTSNQGGIELSSGFNTASTAATTSITLQVNTGSFSTGSTFALYGMVG